MLAALTCDDDGRGSNAPRLTWYIVDAALATYYAEDA